MFENKFKESKETIANKTINADFFKYKSLLHDVIFIPSCFWSFKKFVIANNFEGWRQLIFWSV